MAHSAGKHLLGNLGKCRLVYQNEAENWPIPAKKAITPSD
jgi:hypothetical protein